MSLETVVFLPLPKSLVREWAPLRGEGEDPGQDGGFSHGPLTLEAEIPLPLELEPGRSVPDLEKLSLEMILSGMLRVISARGEGYNLKPGWLDYYRRLVLTVKPGIFGEFTEAAILKAKNGDFPLALEIISALEGLFPGEAAVLLNKALVLEEEAESLEKSGYESAAETRYDEALAVYEEVLGGDPVFPNALFNAGFFFMRQRDFSRALECFSGYLDQDGAEEEKSGKARALVEEISRRGLEDLSFREAYECVRGEREEEGMNKIRRFLEEHPLVWNGWFVLGWALRKLGRWEDGAAAFRKALELGGDNRDTRNELAICLMEMEDYGAARKELESALREDPEDIKIISNLGVLALKEGRDREAAAFFRTVLEFNPQDAIARASLESLEN